MFLYSCFDRSSTGYFSAPALDYFVACNVVPSEWDAEDFDFVNQPWSALHYDARTNHTPRSIKGQKGYIYPDEEMLIHWLITVGHMPVSKAEQVREIYRHSLRAQVD